MAGRHRWGLFSTVRASPQPRSDVDLRRGAFSLGDKRHCCRRSCQAPLGGPQLPLGKGKTTSPPASSRKATPTLHLHPHLHLHPLRRVCSNRSLLDLITGRLGPIRVYESEGEVGFRSRGRWRRRWRSGIGRCPSSRAPTSPPPSSPPSAAPSMYRLSLSHD